MNDELKECPCCKEYIKISAQKCKYCGEFINEKQSNNDLSTKCECLYCSETIPKEAIKCPHCNTIKANLDFDEINEFNSSGMGSISKVPNELKKWNWGAFFLSWIWGIRNKSYLTLLTLLPFPGIFWSFACGLKGNEWAWKNKKWRNIEDFKQNQQKWSIIGFIIFIISIILLIIILNLLT